MKRTLTVAAAVLAAALSTACQSPAAGNPGTAGAAGQGRGGTLVVGMTSSDLPNLDTVLNGQGFEGTRFVGFQLFEGLTHYDLTRDDRVPPVTGALATSWTHSADGRTWTFELRQGVRFHDGTPFDADGVIFNLDRYTKKGDPYATPALQSAASEYTGTFASYRKVDERHVEIVTKEPNGHLPDDLTHVLHREPGRREARRLRRAPRGHRPVPLRLAHAGAAARTAAEHLVLGAGLQARQARAEADPRPGGPGRGAARR